VRERRNCVDQEEETERAEGPQLTGEEHRRGCCE
jgi:hypothetical protein